MSPGASGGAAQGTVCLLRQALKAPRKVQYKGIALNSHAYLNYPYFYHSSLHFSGALPCPT